MGKGALEQLERPLFFSRGAIGALPRRLLRAPRGRFGTYCSANLALERGAVAVLQPPGNRSSFNIRACVERHFVVSHQTYNLDVAVADTFHVGQGQWLVHNAGKNVSWVRAR